MAGVHHLREPLIDHSEGQLFLNEAFKIIVEEVLRKGTNVNQKVRHETHNHNSLRRSQSVCTALSAAFPPSGLWVEGAAGAGSAAGSGAEGDGRATTQAAATSERCRQVQRQDKWGDGQMTD